MQFLGANGKITPSGNTHLSRPQLARGLDPLRRKSARWQSCAGGYIKSYIWAHRAPAAAPERNTATVVRLANSQATLSQLSPKT